MMRLVQHGALVIAFLGLSLVQKVRWEWKIERFAGADSQCIEVRLPPLPDHDDGWLRMNPKPETQPASFMVHHPNSGIEGVEADLYLVTGYAIGDGKTPGRVTADGRLVRPGITVACPGELSLGTMLFIKDIGGRVCEDRGSAIVGKRLDVAFESPEEAMEFGRQWLAVMVIR